MVGPCSTHAGRISKDNLYGECTLTLNVRCEDSHPVGQSKLCFKGVCKCDMKLTDINLHLPGKASRLSRGLKSYSTIKEGVERVENTRNTKLADRRPKRTASSYTATAPSFTFTFVCSQCTRDCPSRVGLHSHSRMSTSNP